jgi:hypothetical protein
MESLPVARRVLVTQEKARSEELEREFRGAVNSAWMAGRMYFRGRSITPGDHGAAPSTAIHAAAARILPDLFPHFVATQVTPAELLQLLAPELAGPSPNFLTDDLGILDLLRPCPIRRAPKGPSIHRLQPAVITIVFAVH